VNWGCSGYVRAWEVLEQQIVPFVRPEREQFFLVVTVGRPSKCTDFAAADTGALFGDFATATLVTRPNNPTFPPRLLLEHSSTALPATRDLSADAALISDALFGYERRTNVLTPTPDGGDGRVPERVCWTMDGMGVLYAAAPAMTGAVDRATDAMRLPPGKINWLLGHQPGRKVMERAAGGLRERGYRAQIPHDLTATTGNIGCSSIPHALATYWDQIEGLVACPGIGMFAPASPYMSQGCLVFNTVQRARPSMPVLGTSLADSGIPLDATVRS
jgi:3-oxoacyl-[acyl-carrier-protein] synthase III